MCIRHVHLDMHRQTYVYMCIHRSMRGFRDISWVEVGGRAGGRHPGSSRGKSAKQRLLSNVGALLPVRNPME